MGIITETNSIFLLSKYLALLFVILKFFCLNFKINAFERIYFNKYSSLKIIFIKW